MIKLMHIGIFFPQFSTTTLFPSYQEDILEPWSLQSCLDRLQMEVDNLNDIQFMVETVPNEGVLDRKKEILQLKYGWRT